MTKYVRAARHFEMNFSSLETIRFIDYFINNLINNFSVTTAKQKPYTGVAGTPLIVPLSANKHIGIENIKECAEGNDDNLFFSYNLKKINLKISSNLPK